MGFDDGPDPLPLGFFESVRSEAQSSGKPLFAPDSIKGSCPSGSSSVRFSSRP
jgi:hypothetical protein